MNWAKELIDLYDSRLPDGRNAAGVQPASEKDAERRGQCKAVLCCG